MTILAIKCLKPLCTGHLDPYGFRAARCTKCAGLYTEGLILELMAQKKPPLPGRVAGAVKASGKTPKA